MSHATLVLLPSYPGHVLQGLELHLISGFKDTF